MALTKKDIKIIQEALQPQFGELKNDIKKLDIKIDSSINSLKIYMDARFAAHDTQFKKIEEKFRLIDKRFEAIDRRFDLIDRQFAVVHQYLEKQDLKFEAIHTEIVNLYAFVTPRDEFSLLEKRVTTVENRLS